MSGGGCGLGPTLAELLDYWLDDAAEPASRVEEHLFACAACSARLEQIASLADAVARIASTGGVGAVMTEAFVQRLKQNGVRVREYRLEPCGSVMCTIAPEDDLAVAHLAAPLEGVARLDVLLQDPTLPGSVRFEDVPFDAASGAIVLAPEAARLRSLGVATQRIALLAVDGARERQLAAYTFNHRPFSRS